MRFNLLNIWHCYLKMSTGSNHYDLLIIDSLFHAWAGTGGILEFVDGIIPPSSPRHPTMMPLSSPYNWQFMSIFQGVV